MTRNVTQPTPRMTQRQRTRMLWLAVVERALKDEAWAWVESAGAAAVCRRAGVSVALVRREAEDRRAHLD